MSQVEFSLNIEIYTSVSFSFNDVCVYVLIHRLCLQLFAASSSIDPSFIALSFAHF
jgi:hypothetical protein